MTAPRDNLVRAIFPGIEVRTEGDGMPTLTGHFARFAEPTTIDSAIEGKFIERIAPGAFGKTFAEHMPKVLFQHGKDPQIGDKPLGVPSVLREDENGAYYEVPLLDTSYNRDLVPALRAGALGASFRFSVVKEDWAKNPTRSATNPDGLPERTIREAKVYEFGPVTFPAYSGATASVRSLTDEYTLDNLTADPDRLRALLAAKGKPLDQEPTQVTPEVRADALEVVVHPIVTTTVTVQEKDVDYITPEDKQARVAELETSITRQAAEVTGTRSVEEQARWDSDKAELLKLRADLAVVAEAKAFLTQHVERSAEPTAIPNVIRTRTSDDIYNPDQFSGIGYRTDDERTSAIRSNALRSIDSQRSPKDLGYLADLVENHDEGVSDNGERSSGALARRILTTGSPVYKRAFAKYLAHGNTMAFTPEEQRAAIAVVGTTTTGGYAVPYIFDPTMFHSGAWTAENPFRKACRTVTITNGNNWRTVTVGAITSAYTTEAAAASENAPAFTQPTYTVLRAQAFATLSIETLEDRPDITGELTSVFAESKDTLEENKFAVGAGTTVPFGMFTDAAYTNQDTATNDVTAIADLQVIEGALPLRYRANAAFFMNRSTLRQLLALDATYRYFTGAGIQFPGNPQPTQLGSNGGGNTGLKCLGYPVWEVPSAVSTLTTDGAIIVVLADPSSYIIVDRIGMNVEVVPTMLNGATPSFPTGQRGIYVYWRNYAAPILADAGRSLSVQ